jgi:DNA-binding NtrC family response regulator
VSKGRILLVDDNESIRESVGLFLQASGYQPETAASLAEALAAIERGHFDAAVIDYMLPDGNALDLLARLKEGGGAAPPVVLLTGHGSIDLAVKAIQAGAEHFLTKPVQMAALLVVLQRLTEGKRALRREAASRTRTSRRAIDAFVGRSPAIRRLAEDARRVAGSDMAVLIQGETGSGKGVLANWLHANGPRAEEALVDLNCAGLNAQFLETELFGHERGAFTGAVSAKQGLFEIAHRGTIFLDEIGDVDPQVQPKLLKLLEEKRFRRLGDVKDRTVDVRLVAATHLDLGEAVAQKRFRSDLFFRISTLPLVVPALRQRPEDIPEVARRLLEGIGASRGQPDLRLDASADRALAAYPWPGNVRELKNVLERAALLADSPLLTAESLRLGGSVQMAMAAALPQSAPQQVPEELGPERISTPPPAQAVDDEIVSLEENERRYIVRVLAQKAGHVEETARALGLARSSLYQRLKRYGIGPSRA